MTTLEDVAKLAGVSIATVSYVINDTKQVKPETRLKVLEAIEQLNYIPNNSARKLRDSSRNEIGIVFPHIDDPYYSEILQGIVFRAEESGYTVNVAFSYNHPQTEKKIIQDFIGRNVSGMVIITCQPGNTEFFKNSIIRYNIPVVFADRMPQGLDVNFFSFDNYAAIYQLTKQLLDQGYERIALFTGPEEIIGEYDCTCAFIDAHTRKSAAYDPDFIFSCDLTKERAFTTSMSALKTGTPQAIISSSEVLSKGITEALTLCHIDIPNDITVITLGIECWNSSNYHPGVLHTSRRAFSLGEECTELLIRNILEPTFFEKKFMLHKDHFAKDAFFLPPPPKQKAGTENKLQLKILATPLPTIHALELVAKDFSSLYGVDIVFEYHSLKELFELICIDSHRPKSEFDIYLFDVSWLSYLTQQNCFVDLTDTIQTALPEIAHVLSKNLENTNYKGRYYGLPIIGGTNLLFYRKDIFENVRVKRMFKEQHQLSLRPPKTWAEFNGIARFFTREFNEKAPTVFGTAITGSLAEELFLELCVRLWSYGGGLYDQNNRLILNSPANIKGMKSILETCSYISGDPFSQDRQKTFKQFCDGEIAMMLSYTEYASELKTYLDLDSDSSLKIGYSIMPGKTPANVGWHLGVSPATDKFGLISEFFRWICQKHISYYMTILDGQSVMRYPYHNHELLKLYPWLKITEEGISLSRSRYYPSRKNAPAVPPYKVESVLCNVFQNIYYHGHSIQDALDVGQREMLSLYI